MATVTYICLAFIIGASVVRAGEYCTSRTHTSWCEGYCCDNNSDCCGEWIGLAIGLSVCGFFVVVGIIVLIICCHNNHKRKARQGNVIHPVQPGPSGMTVMYTAGMPVGMPVQPPPYSGPSKGGSATYTDPQGVHQPMAPQGQYPPPLAPQGQYPPPPAYAAANAPTPGPAPGHAPVIPQQQT